MLSAGSKPPTIFDNQSFTDARRESETPIKDATSKLQ